MICVQIIQRAQRNCFNVATCSHIYTCKPICQHTWILVGLNSSPFSSCLVSVCPLSLCVRLPFECSSAGFRYGRALHGEFPVLIGANSFGHLPGLSLLTCVRLQSGFTDHSVEGHSSTCPPGQEPGWNNNIQQHVSALLCFWFWWKHHASSNLFVYDPLCFQGDKAGPMFLVAESSAVCIFSSEGEC